MNSRFSTAVHILTLLASAPEERITSEMIAGSVGTNPVVIRRQLALLREAGLVESRGARGGGWVLSRNAKDIRLSQVRAALGEEASFRMHKNEPSPQCAIGQNVKSALAGVYREAERAVVESLARWTLEDMVKEARRGATRKETRFKKTSQGLSRLGSERLGKRK